MIRRLQQMLKTPPVIHQSYPRAVYEALLFPLSLQSSGSVEYPSFGNSAYLGQASYMYVPPRNLYLAFFNDPNLMSVTSRYLMWDAAGAAAGSLAFWSIVLLAAPLSFLLLPVSRRRAKVRWGHIARVTVYSLFAPATVLYAAVGLTVLGFVLQSPVTASARTLLVALPVAGLPLALLCWWWAAIKNYLRIPHALMITLLLGILCTLLVYASIFWIVAAVYGV